MSMILGFIHAKPLPVLIGISGGGGGGGGGGLNNCMTATRCSFGKALEAHLGTRLPFS